MKTNVHISIIYVAQIYVSIANRDDYNVTAGKADQVRVLHFELQGTTSTYKYQVVRVERVFRIKYRTPYPPGEVLVLVQVAIVQVQVLYQLQAQVLVPGTLSS